jgi:hypothetical protein
MRVHRSPQEQKTIGREWEWQGHEWEAEGQDPASLGPGLERKGGGLTQQGYEWDRPERGRGRAGRQRKSPPGRGAQSP